MGKAEIRYAFDNTTTFEESYLYKGPIKFPHKGKAYVKAIARDQAGNMSQRLVWECKYDKIPPALRPSHSSGTYTRQFTLTIKASEPATIFYTLDNSPPDPTSHVYRDGIRISKKGVTPIRYIGIDEADNISEEGSLEFMLDFSPPTVRVRIEDGPTENEFRISLKAAEFARINYEVGDKTPALSSPVYQDKKPKRAGQVLRYLAIDKAGNSSKVFVMDVLQKAGVAAAPCLDLTERFSDPQFEARGVHLQVEHPATGVDIIAGLPFKLSDTPCEVRRHAPLLGQDNDYVFGELLQLTKEEIEQLVEAEVIY